MRTSLATRGADEGVVERRAWERATAVGVPALMVLASYVPLFLTRTGQVAADTKQYLYLDPGRLTVGAASMWDPNVGMGTVTHQNIGYLWPMGPYYAAVQWLGIPVWVGQRFWMGSLVLAAGLGAAWCARCLGMARAGSALTGFAYMFSPYIIDYLARTSAIAMPWAALGWLIGLTVVAARSGRWRPVAAFSCIVGFVGGVNATSVLLVGLAPVAWLIYATSGTREISRRQAIRTGVRLGATSAAVSVWWIAGLWAEGRYGLNVLRVTETVPTVAHTSSAAEVLRGLGYWYFYGWDKVQPWTQASLPYTQSLWLIAVGFSIPAVSVALGWLGRWRYRPFALLLIAGGVLVAVGAFPYNRPSLLGRVIESASTGSSLALAMRSVDRIVPLVVLGLALLMGSGIAALRIASPRVGALAGVLSVGLVAAGIPPLWTGQLVAANLSRPTQIPAYWRQAIDYLNGGGSSTRVLGLPGEDFAAYSWGVTEDPVASGLLTRPYVSRQIVPAGTPPAANLLQALDEPLQEGSLDLAALAPVARLMSVGAVLLQSDLQYERYNLPIPQVLWQAFMPTPPGLASPVGFGAPNPAPVIRYPLINEERLALPPGAPQPPALAVFAVPGARPILRTEPVAAPLLVAGDGRGVVAAATAGLLAGDPTVLYSGSFTKDSSGFKEAMTDGARLVLTDTNLRAGQRWGTLSDNIGEVQTLAPPLVSDPSSYALPLFPGAGSDTQTLARLSSVAAVRATAYGNPVTYTPEDRPFNAVDGDPSTAWTFGAHSPVGGERIRVDLAAPVHIDHIRLLQASGSRRLTAVTVELNGRPVKQVKLTGASLAGPGQLITFPAQEVSRVDVIADSATGGAHKRYDGLGSVGLRELSIPGVAPAQETLRLPTDLLEKAGTASLTHALTILLGRLRAPQPPRTDPEQRIVRTFNLPTARTFALGGTAEVSPTAPDSRIDQLIGATAATPSPAGVATVLKADSSGRLIGDRSARAMAAVDGNPATAWTPETGGQVGAWVQYSLSAPVAVDHLDLEVVNDGRHSVPTRLTVAAGGVERSIAVPQLPNGAGRPQGSTSSVSLTFPALTGTTIKVTVDAVREVRVPNYYATFTGATDLLPVSIAELGLPVQAPQVPTQIPGECRSDLVSVDGHPVPVSVTGTTADALGGKQIPVQGCGSAANGLHLTAGDHTVETAAPLPSGWAVDTLALNSAAGGAATSAGVATTPATSPALAASAPASPAIRVTHQDRTSATVTLTGDGRPFWLVLGQSLSSGWTAVTNGGRSLGSPVLIDGYANGWYVPAGAVTGPTTVHLSWGPQRVIWAAIAVSALSLAGLTTLAVLPGSVSPWPAGWGRRRRRDRASRQRLPRLPNAPARSATALVVTLGASIVVAAAARPVTGAVALVAASASARWDRARVLVRVVAVAALIGLGTYIVVEQARWRYWPTIDWPVSFNAANDLAWLAVALLVSDGCAQLLRRSRRQR